MSKADYSGLAKTRPMKRLTVRLKSSAGRNSHGRITVRHRGGGRKRLYRIVDFKQNKQGVRGRVSAVEYDPYRTGFIARVAYLDGDKRYIVAPDNIKVGDAVLASETAPFEIGMRTVLKRIPIGTFVHNVELAPGQGGKIARSAGGSAEVLANEDGYTHLKMPSGEVRRVAWNNWGSIGKVSNPEHNLRVIGKAGRNRWLGVRPTVRASVMNPVDHPYGGGEGRTQRGTRRPKTKWGKITGGHKTRNKKKKSSALILKRRK